MSRRALREAQIMAFGCADRLIDDLESWTQPHDEVMRCRDLEDQLTVLCTIMGLVVRLGDRWLASVSEVEDPLHEAERDRRIVTQALRELTEKCSQVDESMKEFERRNYAVEGSVTFRARWSAMKELLRITSLPANPRPVLVDKSGRITEVSGEEVRVRGLEPSRVLAGLASLREGRVCSLEDFEDNSE